MDTLNRAKQLQDRTKKFAVRIIKAFAKLPKHKASAGYWAAIPPIGNFAGSNYRAACRARSSADFISKISVVSEEADETPFWLELLIDSELITTKKVESQMAECEELLKIFSASLATAKQNR